MNAAEYQDITTAPVFKKRGMEVITRALKARRLLVRRKLAAALIASGMNRTQVYALLPEFLDGKIISASPNSHGKPTLMACAIASLAGFADLDKAFQNVPVPFLSQESPLLVDMPVFKTLNRLRDGLKKQSIVTGPQIVSRVAQKHGVTIRHVCKQFDHFVRGYVFKPNNTPTRMTVWICEEANLDPLYACAELPILKAGRRPSAKIVLLGSSKRSELLREKSILLKDIPFLANEAPDLLGNLLNQGYQTIGHLIPQFRHNSSTDKAILSRLRKLFDGGFLNEKNYPYPDALRLAQIAKIPPWKAYRHCVRTRFEVYAKQYSQKLPVKIHSIS